ncbi:MAG: DUF1080 domain-containing protein [Planctomycetes bacterium]|nr:DUF1080 domain-containing protein [Planctomycetota bacterium]
MHTTPFASSACLAVVALFACAALCAAQEEGFTSLFNGKDLSGWRGDMTRWSVQDGAITGKTTEDNRLTYNTFLIWEGGQPTDFELRFKYRIVGGNSGVQYRSRVIDESKFVVSGYQGDIDSSPRYSGMLYEEKARAIMAERGQKVEVGVDGKKQITQFGDKDELQKKVRNEDWNDYTIIARGNHLQHFVNGELMSEVIDNQSDKAAKSGVIALQVHQGPPMTIQYKDLRIKELK